MISGYIPIRPIRVKGETEFELLSNIYVMTKGVEDKVNDSILWISSMAGLLKFNKFTGQFRRYFVQEQARCQQHTLPVPA